MSPVELRRILAEWRLRVHRIKDILQPATWDETEWRQFSQNLALLVREHGQSWIIDPNVYWDLRWNLRDGGSLVCQIEHVPGEKTSLVVAQNGGFATEVGSYTWLWAEFNMEGDFARDPYWVDGSWRDALMALLLPIDRRSSYMLAGRAETPKALLNQPGARPNNSRFVRSLMPPYILDPEDENEEAAGPVNPPQATVTPDGVTVASPEPESIEMPTDEGSEPFYAEEPTEPAPESIPEPVASEPAPAPEPVEEWPLPEPAAVTASEVEPMPEPVAESAPENWPLPEPVPGFDIPAPPEPEPTEDPPLHEPGAEDWPLPEPVGASEDQPEIDSAAAGEAWSEPAAPESLPAPSWAAMGRQGRLLRERARSRHARAMPRSGARSPHREIR